MANRAKLGEEEEEYRRREEEKKFRMREEARRREEEEQVKEMNDPKNWPELSPSPNRTLKRSGGKKTFNRRSLSPKAAHSCLNSSLSPVKENSGDPISVISNPHSQEQPQKRKITFSDTVNPWVNSKVWSPEARALVDATNTQMANQPQHPPENWKTRDPASVEREEKTPPVQPQRQPRLSSRLRRESPSTAEQVKDMSPPTQHLLADYEEHWSRKIQSENQRQGTEEHLEYTSWIYEDDRERYQYIDQAKMVLESNRAKIVRDEYESNEFPPLHQPRTTFKASNEKEFSSSPAASNPYYTPAATPERDTFTPPTTSFQDLQINTNATNLSDLLSRYSLQDLMTNGENLVNQYTPPESPEVQDDRESYNRRYGHLFYKDGVPYKFFDAVHADKKRKDFGALWTQYGNTNGALNGFTVSPLEHTMGVNLTEEWRDEPHQYWNDLAARRRGKGTVRHAWGDYHPLEPSGNRAESYTPMPDDGDHQLLKDTHEYETLNSQYPQKLLMLMGDPRANV